MSMVRASGSPSERLLFVDLMRGAAMLVMVEVHVVNSLMQSGYRQAPWFALLDFINGLVAPTFLFLSGFALLLSCQPHLDALRRGGSLFRRILGRIGLIWLLGYLIHAPSFSLHTWLHGTTPKQWLHFLSVDILQCIACGLLLFLLARLVIVHEGWFTAVVVLLLCLVVLPAPWLYAMDIGRWLPLVVAVYLAPIGSTLFPLLPWLGFMAVGVLVGQRFLQAREQGHEQRLMGWLALLGGGLCMICHPLLVALKEGMGPAMDERPHLLFFGTRLGWVLVLLAFCFAVCRGREKLTTALHVPSRESLLVYVVHLQLLYHPLWKGQSLVMWAGQRLSLTASLALTLGLIGVLLPLAHGWHLLKRHHHLACHRLTAATLVGGALLFLIS
jgi:uncharacterized membrane protein